jgi:phytoene dehydrogenase-like protein
MAMPQPDVIVVGAGPNGLTAAAVLARAGLKVDVLEAGATIGGSARTEELTLPGFRHDVAAMNLSLFAGSGFMAARGEEMAKHGFDLVPIPQPFCHATAPDETLGIGQDREAMLAQFSPRDRAAWEALEAGFAARAGAIGGLLAGPLDRGALARWGWRTWRALGTDGVIELAQLLVSTPRDFLDAQFEGPRLKTALAAWGMHLDFSPDSAGGAVFPYLEGLAGAAMGMVIGRGGAQTATDALVAIVEEGGGEVRCGAEVDAIRHTGGRVTGVEAGEVVDADAVLATLAPRHLGRLLGETGTPAFDRGLAGFRHAPGTMMIHVALDGPAPWLDAERSRYAYVHVGRDMDDMTLCHAQARAGLLPERPVLVVGQPTLFDPSRAPEGKHILWIQVRMVPGEIRGDAAGEIAATDWAQAAEPYADRIMATLEAHAPGLGALTLARHVVPPTALEAENPNLVGGDQVCGSHALSQNFLFRPVRGWADGRTPIRGLRLIGAATWPGGGTGAASGWRAAQAI